MSPMQHELYARTVLDDHGREAAHYRTGRRTVQGWRERLGGALVGAGDRLRLVGRWLDPGADVPVVAPCADA